VSAGPAREASEAVRTANADVFIRDSVLRGSSEAPISTLISTSGGELTLEGSTLEIQGGRGATGILARGSRISASRNAFRAGRTGEFLHVTTLRDVRGVLDTNLFLDGESRELIIGRLVDSQTAWYNNTIRGGAGSRFTQAFNLSGASRTTLANNVIFHAGEGTGTAVYADANARRLAVTANAFGGWDMVFREAEEGRRWTPPGPGTSRGSQTAAALNERSGVEARGNIDVDDRDVFADDVHLRPGVPLIDAGIHPPDDAAPAVDWDGQERPRADEGAYDIGADEFFR
jgi:hypothetical protein